jgi:hypothetical protein
MGTLSVRENLHFSAALRLPSSTTKQERIARVNKVIKELGLQYCADTKVENGLVRIILVKIREGGGGRSGADLGGSRRTMNSGCVHSSEQWGVGVFFQKEATF